MSGGYLRSRDGVGQYCDVQVGYTWRWWEILQVREGQCVVGRVMMGERFAVETTDWAMPIFMRNCNGNLHRNINVGINRIIYVGINILVLFYLCILGHSSAYGQTFFRILGRNQATSMCEKLL